MTILELIQATIPYFSKNNVDSPRLTIELILAHVLQTTRMKIYLEFDRLLSPQELDLLRPLVKKRAEGFPLEYTLGVASFAGRLFKVSPDVLIPRPETEILLQAVLPLIQEKGLPLLDVGTGSGILAISIAHHYPSLEIWGCDTSEKALAIAQSNAETAPPIRWHHGDLLSASPVTQAQWVLANLPYIPSAIIPTLAREVQQEPLLALDGGVDGLDLIRKLLPQAKALNAHLALEIWHDQAPLLLPLLKEHGYSQIQILQDLRQMDRILIAQIY